jgi:signal transduction histidine kinase
LREGGSDRIRDGLGHVIEDADELMKTFNALLLIARLEAGALDASAETFELAPLVRDVAELYEPVAEEAGLSLTCRAEGAIAIRANRQLIGQAIANLIDNAIKYGRRSEGTAEPSAGSGIEVTLDGESGIATITVADRGPGIPAADRERVLKRFVRLEASRTRPGTGLGLSLVAAVARLHGGSISLADNAPGLRVQLRLPLADVPEHASAR